ncbi:xylanase [Mucilaginibacter achroorhodeus]|uniref:Xylanase n=1 Tax=Mucilaginibacter achroorhodeus TaxID=2599294 RepID=A0A563U4K4_9SPHI|nr:glycoside hydrolase [Mucilaginibacter achroorhodeus]TWR26252.1 xylanase [Mucilaginibacter achroorhodeus]
MTEKLISRRLIFIIFCFSAASSLGQSKVITLNIDPSEQYQVIDNFGASDAWACQFVGQWPDVQRNKIADLLFSNDTTGNGQPKGIALSLWRFNIGAGTAEQEAKSEIPDEWHRAECFADSNGNYNWRKQAGQQWFLKAAKARGVKQFLAFNNSPPVWLTRNGRAFADSGRTNIAADKYPGYAKFLAAVISGLKKSAGVKFDYISPVNEPQWKWSDNKQEGSPFNNQEIAVLAREIDKEFIKNKITTKLAVAEAGSIQYIYQGSSKNKGNQAEDFFAQGSENYIGNLPSMANLISTHSYFTTSPYERSVKDREALADKIATVPGLKFWQSEYCILGDNDGEIKGNGRDLGMTAALYMARVINTDLTVANATAWQWWTAISPYDYKDGLVYVDKNKTGGAFYDSKMLWVLGNYSRFVHPGFKRVAADIGTGIQNVYLSAYIKGKQLVCVVINNSSKDATFSCMAGGREMVVRRTYTTSASGNLKPGYAKSVVTIPAQSVVTLLGRIK